MLFVQCLLIHIPHCLCHMAERDWLLVVPLCMRFCNLSVIICYMFPVYSPGLGCGPLQYHH